MNLTPLTANKILGDHKMNFLKKTVFAVAALAMIATSAPAFAFSSPTGEEGPIIVLAQAGTRAQQLQQRRLLLQQRRAQQRLNRTAPATPAVPGGGAGGQVTPAPGVPFDNPARNGAIDAPRNRAFDNAVRNGAIDGV
jgi:hypothetical protein